MAGRHPRFKKLNPPMGKPGWMDTNTIQYLDKVPPLPPPQPVIPSAPPAPFASTEWLAKGINDAVKLGPDSDFGYPNHYLRGIADDREFLYNLQKVLESKGVTELDPMGEHGLPRQGSFKSTFSAGDNVLKFGEFGNAEWESGALPHGVWGVNPLSEAFDFAPTSAEDGPAAHKGVSVYVQPRTELMHPIHGSPQENRLHHKTLTSALEKQGWIWSDDHLGNMAFLKGDEYNPVVIDGDVRPWAGAADYGQARGYESAREAPRILKFPGDKHIRQGFVASQFTPPTKPDWYYSVLLPLLMSAGGGEEQQKQPPGLLSGLTESY